MNRKYTIAMFTLFLLACSTAVLPAAVSAPVPIRAVSESPAVMVVCGSYGLHVRQAAGADKPLAQDAVLADGTRVVLTGETATPQVWAWYEISEPVRGWVHSKYLCEEAK